MRVTDHNLGDEVEFGWQPLEDAIAEPGLRELVLSQWAELSHLPDIPLSPNFALMAQLEKSGHFKVWSAHNDGLLVGFIQFQIFDPLGYTGVTFACDCGWYLDPECKSPWIAGRMWREAESALKDLGVRVLRAHDNEKRPLTAFFRRLGYAPVATQYQKAL